MSERMDKFEKMFIESNKRFDERFNKMVEEDKERRKEEYKIREIERGKREEERKKDKREAYKSMKKLEKTMDGMGMTQGEISEEIIYDNFSNIFRNIGERLSTVERNIIMYSKGRNRRIIGEFDIIGVNGTKIFIGETKTKLTNAHIDKMVNITIPNFKKYDNRHDGMKVYGVIGARVFVNKGVLKHAIKHGLYVIKETHKQKAEILKESLVGIKSF